MISATLQATPTSTMPRNAFCANYSLLCPVGRLSCFSWATCTGDFGTPTGDSEAYSRSYGHCTHASTYTNLITHTIAIGKLPKTPRTQRAKQRRWSLAGSYRDIPASINVWCLRGPTDGCAYASTSGVVCNRQGYPVRVYKSSIS